MHSNTHTGTDSRLWLATKSNISKYQSRAHAIEFILLQLQRMYQKKETIFKALALNAQILWHFKGRYSKRSNTHKIGQ